MVANREYPDLELGEPTPLQDALIEAMKETPQETQGANNGDKSHNSHKH